MVVRNDHSNGWTIIWAYSPIYPKPDDLPLSLLPLLPHSCLPCSLICISLDLIKVDSEIWKGRPMTVPLPICDEHGICALNTPDQ